MNKDKRNNIQLLGTLNNSDESGIIANANQIYDANEDKSTQDVSKEHKERIETLETKESSMQTTLENITKTGEASAASNVTYNHNDSKLDATNVQQAIDEVRKRSNYNDGDSIIDFNTIHIIKDNPEFVIAAVDVNDRILYGIKSNGQPYWGIGVPKVVRDYVDKQVNDILGTNNITETIDSLKEVEKFLSDFKNSDTLKALLDNKANKVDVVFDISAYHATGGTLATYADLTAALGTNGKNIPQSLIKGGMSVKFVQSSDNKYVQYRLMANEFTTDTTQWAIADEGVYVENPEFIYIKTDKDDKILWAIRTDGSIYYGACIPPQIKDYIEERIADLSLDEYEDIVAFLNGLEEGDKTLQMLLNEKVDKEEGKSLIDAEYAEGVHYIESPEFAEIKVDAEKRILEATYKDGTKLFPAGVETPKVNLEVANIENKANPEYVEVKVDEENKLLEGTKSDGTKVIGGNLEVGNNLNVKGDVEVEGNVSYKNGIPQAIIDYVAANNIPINTIKQDLQSTVDASVTKMQQDVTDFIDEETAQYPEIGSTFNIVEDPEGRHEVTTDKNGKITSYRKPDGTKVESVGFETPKANIGTLTLSSEGMDDFQQALKDAGFKPGGAGDYSDTITKKGKNPVYIPTPRCAILNILSDVNLTTLSKADRADGVQKVNYDVKIKCEFFDGHGIYFKKTALIGAQGNSSMGFIKKNLSLKFFDTDNVKNSKGKWGKGDTFGTVFGDWVMQKTYHLKAYHTDFVRGAAVAAYQLADEVYKTRGIFEDRPWKKALIDFNSTNSYTPAGQHSNGIDNMALQMDNGARCMPDGFPVIVYQNGEFYGIFSWQLKKDAANFNMDAGNPLHIHIDGTLSPQNLWLGNINWTAFEVRNPEDLVDMNGNDYDGDHPTELIDSSSSHYDATNKAHVMSSQVKQAIISLSQRIGEINALRATDDAAAKELFDTYFDADNLVDYEIINMACGDTDGFGKNWQWTTWDGAKWYVNQYDKDMAFGNYFTGMYTTAPKIGFLGNDINSPMGLAIRWYQSEIKARWQAMVSKGIFSSEHIISLITAWMNRIGQINYEKEWAKWTDAPCNRDNGIDYENWEFVLGKAAADIPLYSSTVTYPLDYFVKTEGGTIYKSLVSNNRGNNPTSDDGSHWKEIPVWRSTTTYNIGDEVLHMATETWYILMKAVKTNLNKVPFVRVSTKDVAYLGYRDSIWRYAKYIKDTIDNQNIFINNF